MSSDRVVARPLPGAPFGTSVELSYRGGPIDPVIAAQLRQLLAQHQVLVFSGELSDSAHVSLISAFGRVLPQGPRVQVDAGPPPQPVVITFVSNVDPGGLGASELLFHHDMAHLPTPLTGLSLYAQSVGANQAATRFASGRRAYDQLPPPFAQRLEGLQALFVGNYTTLGEAAMPARAARRVLDPTWPFAVHPVVVRHPVSGQQCVYVNEMQTLSVLGLAENESDDLLDLLFAHIYDPTNIYEHEWRKGDLVVWDNLSVQHARRKVDERSRRTLRRVVFGERTPWEEWPAVAS